MASITEARSAVISRILGMTGRPNVIQSNAPSKDCPRYVIQNAGQILQTATVDGTSRVDLEVLVRVETDAGDYDTENEALVQALIDRFPVTTRFDGVTVLRAPEPRPALVADGIYITPVYIRVFTSF